MLRTWIKPNKSLQITKDIWYNLDNEAEPTHDAILEENLDDLVSDLSKRDEGAESDEPCVEQGAGPTRGGSCMGV